MLDIAFVAPALPPSGALVLLLAEAAPLADLGQQADQASGGLIARALAAADFTGKAGQSCTVLAPCGGIGRVVAVGLGDGALTETALNKAAGRALSLVSRDAEATLDASALTPAQAALAASAMAQRAYRFDLYRTKEKPEDKPKLAAIKVAVGDVAAAAAAWVPQAALIRGVFLTRDLVTEPANILYPAEFADRAAKLSDLGVKVEVLDRAAMTKLGFGALLGVAQGSAREARMVVMRWDGAVDPTAKPVCFVGKGVTFDSGGISIKPALNMEDMKWDMAGAGVVTGLMAALAGRHARVNAVGLIGLVENMPSSTAQRPGDVVTSYSGQTIEVLNTDAEGRLVLADVLWYAQEKFDPVFMVDLATLTGAIIIALGHEHAGLFSNDDQLANNLLAAGIETDEKLWRLPLSDAYDRALKSDIADMKNIGGRPAGSITAAQFIQRFVNKKPWAHLDIAAMAWALKEQALCDKGATGYGVRLLDRLVANHYEI